MITETTINLYPIIKYIGLFVIIGIFLFLVHNLGGLKIFSKHDNKLVGQFIDRFPLVSPEFMTRNHRAQNIENNQEIHELNQRIDHLERYIDEINKKVDEKLEKIIEELGKRG